MIQDICLIIIAAALSIRAFIHVPMLLQFRRTALEVEKAIEAVRMQVAPLSHDLAIISQEVNRILASVHRQVESVGEGVDTFRDTALRLRRLEEDFLQKVEKPLLDATTVIRGVLEGIHLVKRLFTR
jgi:uncharacterized protein YoxC